MEFTTRHQLQTLVKKYQRSPDDSTEAKIDSVDSTFPVVLSEYLMQRLEVEFLPEIAKQFLPCCSELLDHNGAGAFFDDEIEISETVFQKYPNRCIIYTTSQCYANCRYCSRKERWSHRLSYSKYNFDNAIFRIRTLPEIEEVLLTGGDIFANSIEDLEYMLQSLSQIQHVKIIRLATRAFTTNPSILTDELCSLLSSYNNIIMCTQFNHSSEFSPQTIAALLKIQKLGIPILNQSVLLSGVNDSTPALRDLLTACAANRVIPYYLFHCFKVKGVQHFRTSPLLGERLIASLAGQVGGWWLPRYVLIPHTTGIKIPICLNGVIENSKSALLLRDFTGREIRYD